METIKIKNQDLWIAMHDFLKQKGLRDSFYSYSKAPFFTSSELESINKIVLNNAASLDEIENLINLEELQIISKKLTIVNKNNYENEINTITDFSNINKLLKLKSLQIINDNFIEKLDVSNLSKLQKLVLLNNENLIDIKGLDELFELKWIEIVGSTVTGSFDIRKYLENTKDTVKNTIDVNMYHHLVKNDPSLVKYIDDTGKKFLTELTFGELTGVFSYMEIEVYRMKELYLAGLKILSKILKGSEAPIQKIENIYKYIVENVTYDFEGLHRSEEELKKLLNSGALMNDLIKKRIVVSNSSFSAALLNTSNCEGYVNLAKFLLNIVDVKAGVVYCTDKDSVNIANGYNHAILKFKHNGHWYYGDPTVEKDANNLQYFFKTKELLKKDYTLPLETQQLKLRDKEKTR